MTRNFDFGESVNSGYRNNYCLVHLLVLGTALLTLFSSPLNGQDQGLNRQDAEAQINECWLELTEPLKQALGNELAENLIQIDEQQMKLLIREFGEIPPTGRSLYISMHGGGGAPSRVNDQQWRNQIRLYQPEEGIYIAPRAPTDNWNLWHESHIDPLFDRLILACVLCREVDPNRVYLMGYSAGGDGVFQLAPRMADRWAAAAMMAGHPNETSPDGLRNLPFGLFMGGLDSAYDRNKHAQTWKDKLEELALNDPGGYPHLVKIYPDSGHWMNLQDNEAVPWMAQHKRNCWPTKLVWLQDDVTHERLYWVGVPKQSAIARSIIKAKVDGQTISIDSDIERIVLYLNDELTDLDQPVKIQWNGQVIFNGLVQRTSASIQRSLNERLDDGLAATVILEFDKPESKE